MSRYVQSHFYDMVVPFFPQVLQRRTALWQQALRIFHPAYVMVQGGWLDIMQTWTTKIQRDSIGIYIEYILSTQVLLFILPTDKWSAWNLSEPLRKSKLYN